MRLKILKLSTVALFLIILGIGCEEEPIETDPAKIILGKWELIEMGTPSNMKPVESDYGFTEYLPDSIVREYVYETGKSHYYKKYWIDTLLHVAMPIPDNRIMVKKFRYSFSYNNNIMDCTLINKMAIYNTAKYKRIRNKL
jgi:hypothetical protein